MLEIYSFLIKFINFIIPGALSAMNAYVLLYSNPMTMNVPSVMRRELRRVH
jgi:hypothetical protein